MRCPDWCVTHHGSHLGEENWLHLSEPLTLDDGVVARLCLSAEPGEDAADGPYVLIGTTEYTVQEAEALGATLVALAGVGGAAVRSSRHAADGTPPAGR